jgi:Sulfotransferase domain
MPAPKMGGRIEKARRIPLQAAGWWSDVAVEFTREIAALLFKQPNIDGSFDDLTSLELESLGRRRPLILFAFPPKSAGTFLRTAAIAAVNGQFVRMVHAQGGRDGQPYLPSFVAYYTGLITDDPLVTHIHMQALPANIHFLEAFGIRPIVMLRDIADMLVSYCEMVDAAEDLQGCAINCLIPEHFSGMAKGEKADFLIDLIAPWYVSYYATWCGYAMSGPDRVCVLRYGDFLADPAAVLGRALEFAGLARDRETCRKAVQSTWAERKLFRFNRGVAGRGAAFFTPAHKARLAHMVSHYPQLEDWRADLLGVP